MTVYLSGLDLLPGHMREGVMLYIQKGICTGHFLLAVFGNDLVEAFNRADRVNIVNMENWVRFLYNHAPSGCWGSPTKVAEWMEHRGLEGMNT